MLASERQPERYARVREGVNGDAYRRVVRDDAGGRPGPVAAGRGSAWSARMIDPTEQTGPIGRGGVRPTRLGLGTAEIGGLFRPVAGADAARLLEHAWRVGIRSFDTAPLYGYGTAERRLGRALAARPRDAFVVSTKVGRLLVPRDAVPPGADVDRQADGATEDAFYAGAPPVRVVFDYSADGVRRSLEESLRRLGLDRVDIAYIHDPDEHWQVAIDEAFPALARLREDGTVGAIGVGMNEASMLARFVREADPDILLVANRYTLLDQSALAELLPLCVERRVAVAIGGVMNSGLLADPRPGARFDYRAAPPELVDRARRLGDVCARHGVPLRTAAIRFPLAHPAVVTLIAGVRSIAHLDEYPAAMAATTPTALWEELRADGLIARDAPVPS
jgi:D-threo-aldose 1-dehydrogenase